MKNDEKVLRRGTIARKVTLATGAVVMTAGLMSAFSLRGGGSSINGVTCYQTYTAGGTLTITKCTGCKEINVSSKEDSDMCFVSC